MNHGDIAAAAVLPVWAPYIGVLCMAFLAWMARHRGCTCEKCGFHVNENRMKRERNRAMDHKATHQNYGRLLPWGDDRCGACKAGHEDDRDLR